MPAKPPVSVITIFWNSEQFIEEAIQSVFAQTYSHWELLLVDDGSTDSSAEIAQQYARQFPEKVKYLEHPGHENRGMSAARNLGIRSAEGKYIAFLDSDDVWLPHKLERQISIMESNPLAGMLYGASEFWHGWTLKAEDITRDNIPDLGVITNRIHHPPSLALSLYPLGTYAAPCPSDLMLRRDIFDEVGGFEEDFKGMYEDQAFLIKVYMTQPVYVSSETWDKYRIHPDSCLIKTTGSGEYESFRGRFLKWFEQYLIDRNRNWGPVWERLQQIMGRVQQNYYEKDNSTAPTSNVGGALESFGGNRRRLTPLSSYWGIDRGLPIDRYYIENFLLKHSADIYGRTLEIEDDTYTRRFGGDKTTQRDILHLHEGNPRATIIGDLTCADHIPTAAFDSIVLTQTLQLIYDTRLALKTLHRILKTGGTLFATFPGITQISQDVWEGFWYWSFTTTSAKRLFGEFFQPENLEVLACGNVLVASAFLYGYTTEEMTREELDYHDPNYELLITVRARK